LADFYFKKKLTWIFLTF
jgi:signal peptidase